MTFTEETKLLIKDAILNYCEGIEHVEFNLKDLDKMVSDIEGLFEVTKIELTGNNSHFKYNVHL